MPIQLSPLEMLALQLGEAINDDVAAWGVALDGCNEPVLSVTTRDGRTYQFHGVEVESEGDVA